MQMRALSRPTVSRLQRFMLTRPAPMGGNDLCGLGATDAEIADMAAKYEPGVELTPEKKAYWAGEVDKANAPGIWSKIGSGIFSFAQSDAAAKLAQGAASLYTAQQASKANAAAADASAKSSSAAQKLAALQAQTAALLAGKKTTPTWVMPAAIIGGVAVVGLIAFLVLRKKSA